MATKTKTTRAGKVGLTPKGNYAAGTTYDILDVVLYNHDSWVSLSDDNKGNTPSASSTKWKKLTDGGEHSYEQGDYAKTQGDYAKAQGDDAKEKAANAEYQAGQAESAARKAANVNAYMVDYDLKVTDRDGHTSSTNVKGDKGEGINYATMTDAQKNELAAKVIQQICTQNVIGPRYDADHRCINYDLSNGVKYDEATRSIKLG